MSATTTPQELEKPAVHAEITTESGILVQLRKHNARVQIRDPDTGSNLGTVDQYLGQFMIYTQLPGGRIFRYGYVSDGGYNPVNSLVRLPSDVSDEIFAAIKTLLDDPPHSTRKHYLAPPEPEIEDEEEYDEEYDEDEENEEMPW